MLRSSPEDYTEFFDHYVKAVVGKFKFSEALLDPVCTKEKEVATISDEAFALLLVENSYNRWIDIAEHFKFNRPPRTRVSFGSTNSKDYVCGTKTKYTSGGIFFKKDGETQPNDDTSFNEATEGVRKGWSNEGIRRYNELVDLVTKDRVNHPSFFREYKENAIKEARLNANKKRKCSYDVVPTVAKHELFTDDEEETIANRAEV